MTPAARAEAYKVFTRNLRSPIRGGPPVWDGSLPHDLPRVEIDTSAAECAAGWSFAAQPETALRIAGLWPDGRPSRLFRCEISDDALVRGRKIRSATGTIVGEITDLRPALLALHAPFGDLVAEVTEEALLWREALARPRCDAAAVEAQLRIALSSRDLRWSLRRFPAAKAAWAARDAKAAWPAWSAWPARAARDAMSAWDAWAARDAKAAWPAWSAWSAWPARAARDAMSAWDAWSARDAMSVFFTARRGWVAHDQDLLSAGIRAAYASGLALAIPTGPTELGWAMEDR